MPEEGADAPATTGPGTSPGRGQSPSTRTEPRLSNSVHTQLYNKCFLIKSGEPYVMSNEIKGDGNSTLRHRVKSNGSVGTFPSELAEGDPGSVDPEHGEGILNFISGYPPSGKKAIPKPLQPGPAETGGTGDQGPVSQRDGDGAINRTPRLFSLHPVSSPKKGWRSETSHQSEESQLLCGSSTFFKMEGIQTMKSPCQRRIGS